jgi:hypothetical protein
VNGPPGQPGHPTCIVNMPTLPYAPSDLTGRARTSPRVRATSLTRGSSGHTDGPAGRSVWAAGGAGRGNRVPPAAVPAKSAVGRVSADGQRPGGYGIGRDHRSETPTSTAGCRPAMRGVHVSSSGGSDGPHPVRMWAVASRRLLDQPQPSRVHRLAATRLAAGGIARAPIRAARFASATRRSGRPAHPGSLVAPSGDALDVGAEPEFVGLPG